MPIGSLEPATALPVAPVNAGTGRRPGALVISLDFELQWGVRDRVPLDRLQRARLLAARNGIPRILEMFKRCSVHATWATVGMLFASSREELQHYAPLRRPEYHDLRLRAYGESLGRDENDDPFHFAPGLIAEIARHPGQEIGSHSFSHYYCMEPGQSLIDFAADTQSAVAIAAAYGHHLRSYVFPRNQANSEYLRCLLDVGICSYRENEPVACKKSAPFAEQRRARDRAARLLDTYVDIQGDQSSEWPAEEAPIVSVPSSRYLRSYRPELAPFESLLLRRIENAMRQAAIQGKIFHLWWHPEDFADALERNLRLLREVLNIFLACRERHGMLSLGMGEVYESSRQCKTQR